MNRAYLLIGGNMGERISNLDKAKKLIHKNAGGIINSSSIYETEPWGVSEQPAFLNQVLLIKTRFSGNELLQQLLSIEKEIGRIREVKFGPRIIDIDILFFNEDIITTNELVIPHPEIQNRRFALVPMNEIADSFVHPVIGQTIGELLDNCSDKLDVKVVNTM